MGTTALRQHPQRTPLPRAPLPRAPLRRRVAGWRARNWRRAILAWFVLALAFIGVAAEPATDFPRAQLDSVPAVRVVMRTAAPIVAAGIPVLLAALP
jgi:hypothetical protein